MTEYIVCQRHLGSVKEVSSGCFPVMAALAADTLSIAEERAKLTAIEYAKRLNEAERLAKPDFPYRPVYFVKRAEIIWEEDAPQE